jgi:hypothetical protein
MVKVLTLEEYATKIGVPKDSCKTISNIQDYAEEWLDVTLFDYPLEELDYVLTEVNDSVCIVRTEFGLRICEL